jgi:glycosyltransferase involved in cell wall biosynthesis
VKYLRNYGWEPILYIPQNPEYPEIDSSLGKEIPERIKVYSHPIWEPYSWYKKFTGKDRKMRIKPQVVMEKDATIAQKISIFIRGNFFIPDARKYWIKPSVRYLSHLLKTDKIDAIFSTSPPQSVHLIAMKLSEKCNIPWLADFRDPWTKISYFEKLYLTKSAKNLHLSLEKKVLQSAGEVVTVSSSLAKDFQVIGKRKVHVVTNGFDGEIAEPNSKADIFSLTYIGTLTQSRVPENFWNMLADCVKSDEQIAKKFSLTMLGNIEEQVFESTAKAGLQPYLQRMEYLPHDQVLETLRNSFALLLFGIPNDKGVLTGKVFEYMQSTRPILSVSPAKGDLEAILEETKTGFNADYDEPEKVKNNVLKLIEMFKTNEKWEPDISKIKLYSRAKTTEKLASILDKMVSCYDSNLEDCSTLQLQRSDIF